MNGIIADKITQEIEATMLKARDAKYSVPLRYGKVLFVELLLPVNQTF